MKILILNPPYINDFCRSARWAAKSRGRVQRHPDWLLIAAAVLEKENYNVKFIDGAALNLKRADVEKEYRDFQPNLVVLHTTTPSIYNDISYAVLAKDILGSNVLTVLVGPHVTSETENTFRIADCGLQIAEFTAETPSAQRKTLRNAECSGAIYPTNHKPKTQSPKSEVNIVDYIAIGEYDYTLRDLAKAINNSLQPSAFSLQNPDSQLRGTEAGVSGQGIGDSKTQNPKSNPLTLNPKPYPLNPNSQPSTINTIPGAAYWKDGKVVYTSPRPYLDVNELPFPAWHHICPEWYNDGGKRMPFLTLLSGRGCLGRCTFCRDTPLMEGQTLRLRNPSLVVDEMEYDINLFPYLREIMFETDTFTASSDHVRGVCEEIIRRKLKINWSCNVRVDMDLSFLLLMKRANCRMLMVGFEFGSQRSLDAVEKGISLEQSKKFAKAAHKLGFIIHGCFMIGAPGETKETAEQTIKFAKSLPLDTVQFSGICTYPGTKLYDWAKKNNFLIPTDWTEWVSKDFEQITLLNYPQLSKIEIDSLIDKGLQEFYLRPRQILRMIFAVRSLGDIKRKFFGLKSFLSYWRQRHKNKVEVALLCDESSRK